MNSITWTNFFKEAGIPLTSAENYATLFEDNRITKEMLLDLNKEILQDIGINVIGDIIAILKHAKKAHQKELKAKDDTAKKTSVSVAPMITVAPPIATPTNDDETEAKEFEGAKGFEDIQYTTASYQKKMAEQTREPIQVGKLLSDGMKFKKLEDPMVLEEYTTATYEARLNLKRSAPQLNETDTKVLKGDTSDRQTNRVVILPSAETKHNSVNRSRRFLEAAGCFRSTSDDVTQKASVFSRLEIPPDRLTSDQTIRSNIKSRLGSRKSSPPHIGPVKSSKLYSDFESTNVRSRLGPKKTIDDDESVDFKPTMVADTVSKHSDVHARLKKKGLAVDMPKGPLGKRLGDHAVFTRLE